MKKLLFILVLPLFVFVEPVSAQCVPSCSAYATTTVVCAPVGVAGHNTVTSFSSLDDSFSSSIPIGFTFTFFCNSYTNFLISTNGFITFDLFAPNNGCCNGYSIPDVQTPNDYIAFHWNDLNLNLGGSVTYTTIGTAPNRQCIITYTNVPHYSYPSALNSGQIKLFETSNTIEVHSDLVTADPSSSPSNGTQGIENSTGSNGYPSSLATNGTVFSLSNVAYKWFLGGTPTAPTSVSGNNILCEGAMDTFVSATMPGASSYNWLLPPGWIGTSTISAISATAGVSGNLSVTATYSCGTSAVTTISVTVNPSPTLSINASTLTICSGQSLSINGTGGSVINFSLVPSGLIGTPPFVISPDVSTIYSLVGENAFGCFSFNSPTVSIFVKPTPTVQVNSGAICLGEPFTIIPTGATTYVSSSTFLNITPLTAGIKTYSVTGSNGNGCISNTAICTVTVNVLPNVNLTAIRPVICMKESTPLTATGATTYTWTNNTSSASTLTVNPLTSTVYTVSGTALGCSNTATVLVTVNSCVGLNELNALADADIQIYPNPSNGEFILNTVKNIDVRIYDVNGKVIYRENLSEGKHKIDLNNFASGNYFLKASNGSKEVNQVLIKQ